MMSGSGRKRSCWRVAVVFCGIFLASALAHGGWKPGKNPNPERILDQAWEDRAAGRYGDALAKYVWFHNNALKYAPAMYGVRLSFALGAWVELSSVYPPALEALKVARDEAESKVRQVKDPRHAFHDFESINSELKEDAKTRDLLTWLDANSPAVAAQVFDIAVPSLVRSKEYSLCGKYLEPVKVLGRAVRMYRAEKEMSAGPDCKPDLWEHARRSFSNSMTTVVALLVVNDRKNEAERIAAEATKECDDETFREEMKKALNGEVPDPWP